MLIKLNGVSLQELELALKYSGLFVDSDPDKNPDYAEIKPIPAFLLSDAPCRCSAASELLVFKDKARKKVVEVQENVLKLGYKIEELAIKLGEHEVRALKAKKSHYKMFPNGNPYEESMAQAHHNKEQVATSLEFWEKLGEKYTKRK